MFMHTVPSEELNELILCMHVDFHTLISPNREPMDVLLSLPFFSWRKVKKKEKETVVFLSFFLFLKRFVFNLLDGDHN